MKRVILLILIFVAAFVVTSNVSPAAAGEEKKMGEMVYSKSAIDLRMDMRKLWEDHITWTRNYIISAVANLEDAGKVAERLLKNQDDIGDAIKPFYGNEAGEKLAALLKDHILVAVEVVKTAKAGNAEELANANKKWYANADEIAVYLNGANPKWPKKGLENMLNKHLEYTLRRSCPGLRRTGQPTSRLTIRVTRTC